MRARPRARRSTGGGSATDRLFRRVAGRRSVHRPSAEVPPAALILRSPFPSTVDAARHHYPYLPIVEPLVLDRWPVARHVADEVRVPVLVLVAGDEIVPPHLSRRVHEAAREPKRLAEISAEDHNDPALLDGRELLAEIDTFLDEWVRRER